jgi:adenylate cyclase
MSAGDRIHKLLVTTRRRRLQAISVLICAAIVAAWALDIGDVRQGLRERSLDRLLPLLIGVPQTPALVVVDIDRETLARYGSWPWPRTTFAELVRSVAEAQPAAVGVDILLDARSIPAGGQPGTDGNDAIAAAARQAPMVFGFVLEDAVHDRGDLPAAPIFMRGRPRLPDIWSAGSVVGPASPIAKAAEGFGALTLAPDSDGLIRRIPLLVSVNGALRPGLAAELLRVGVRAGAFLVEDAPARLQIGAVSLPLDSDAQMRVVPTPQEFWRKRTVSALAVMTDPGVRARLDGQVVMIGSGAPELGGLRVGPATAATPSVQIHADAIERVVQGLALSRPSFLLIVEIVATIALAGLVLALARWLRPLHAALLTIVALLVWAGASVTLILTTGLLIDPAGPATMTVATFGILSVAAYAENDRRSRALQRRFEQHLAPEVVKRLVQNPELLRLEGELREITALFTDLEDFTAMTEKIEPRDLVAILDEYLDAITGVVVAHGGMIDKIVGDGVHAIFNAPLLLPDHPLRAFECAKAILVASESVRKRRPGLGRTRIGIETGSAVVGDVGGGRKLDYTAHGAVMNTAARLEAANKELGTSICIGPNAAARLDQSLLRPLGPLAVRGRSEPLAVYTCAHQTV